MYMGWSRIGAPALFAAAVIACSRPDATPSSDSNVGTTASGTTSAAPSDWSDDLGRVLLVPSDSENTAVVLVPQGSPSQLQSSTTVTLVNSNGDTTVAKI